MTVIGTYDSYLVALSILVACFASYTALDLGGRVRVSRGLARGGWLAIAAIAMGGGIWSMHFIAMLAFVMPMPVGFDLGQTALSLIVAMAVTGIGFYVIGTRGATLLQLGLSGLFMGLGIVAMHYTGMAAMRMSAHLRYNQLYVALSVFIAIGASTAALWLAFRATNVWQRVVAAVVMGFAISGMHYTGMAAASFTARTMVDEARGAASFAETSLALAVAGITFVILACALIASLFDRQFAVLAERETVLLRRSEEQFRQLYRATPLPLYSLAPDGTIEQASDAWLELLGYERAEALGKSLADFMTEDSKARYAQSAWPVLQAGGEIKEAEFQLLRKSGAVLDVLLSARVERSGTGSVRTLSGLIDITARKHTEEALRQSQRMEAMGQLTGGVAHDFNNLLMVISGATYKLGKAVTDPATGRALDMIANAVKRGQNLTNQLLSFARRQTLDATVVDLAAFLPNVSEMLRRSLRGDIEIRTSAPAHPYRIRIDPTELELALLNLGVNARDAMPSGGALTVAIKNVTLAGDIETDALLGDFVVIEVSDTGKGIPPDILPRVFEPFFTTKDAGRGTGLGLSQVYGFAKQSGGTARVRSKPGEGTTVALYLPATDEPVASRNAEARASDADVSAEPGGIVLVVEDNEEVAAISTGYFEQLGYQAHHASNGADALDKLQSNGAYNLIFSDILMPGSVGGLELARIVREQYPKLPILLTTGYSQSAQQAVSEGFCIVPKPYDLRDLSSAVRNLRSRMAATGSRQEAVKRYG
jgi:PAS domain S-box-containing protein